MNHSSRKKKSTHREKALYLAAHPELWGSPSVAIANALKAAGLVAPTTSPVDLRLRNLVAEAKAHLDACKAL